MNTTLIAALAASVAMSTPATAQDDTADIESTIDALYAVISGPVGQERDFNAMRAMFMEGAAMGAVGAGEGGNGAGSVITLDDYIERSGPWLVENGFTERATRTEIDQWGEIAYARSAYEGVNGVTGEVFLIGVNYITLFKIDGDWKIASILWRTESEDWPVDAAFE
ncbi:hypothetical protein [Maricaulis maris]|uniref:Nuclear transport factor 2 family protein n=1 Tax=Maricaulis maris TaxID=74318 RepID=A0A495D2L4_9PROT|nr:hypothetical protein [Maricaulis maris]RKQ96003.1 hypothetical protein C7435_2252 [Maricaulis maris]